MITKEGARDPEPKSTPEDKAASEVEEQVTGTPEKQAQESKESKEKAGVPETSEELAKMKSELGRLKQELGDERKKAEEYSAYKLAWERAQQQQQQTAPKPQEPDYDSEFFDKPTQTIQKILQEYDMRRTYQDAIQSAPSALQQAKLLYPERFEGVDENMINQIMYAPVQQGQMNPAVLRDPNMWAGAAWIAKGYQTGYKMPEPALKSMNPNESERPGMPPPNEDTEIPSLKGDDLTEVMLQELMRTGITREQAIKEVAATRESEGR